MTNEEWEEMCIRGASVEGLYTTTTTASIELVSANSDQYKWFCLPSLKIDIWGERVERMKNYGKKKKKKKNSLLYEYKPIKPDVSWLT